MITGVLLFLLTPAFMLIDWDTDIIGLLVFMLGVALLVAGIVVKALARRKL